MKKFEAITNTVSRLILLGMIASLGFVACKKEGGADTTPPLITKVTTTTNPDEHLDTASLGQWIRITGAHLATTQQVFVNTVEVSREKYFASDTTITLELPSLLPDPVRNPIRVVTQYGEAVFDYVVLQPLPVIQSISPLAGAAAGDTLYVKGLWFINVSEVKLGDMVVETYATSDTLLKVKVPDNAPGDYVYVNTSAGTGKSENAYGFNQVIFDDALSAPWWNGGWSGTTELNATDIVARGSSSVKRASEGWGAFGLGGASIDLAGFKAIKVSLYGASGAHDRKVKLVLNAAGGKELMLTEGKWTTYTIPLSELGNPATLTEIWIQEFTGNNSLFYIDDLGLI